jgi:predicted amidohydrolase YtcJ
MLLRGGRIHAPGHPGATALAIADGRITWLGHLPGEDLPAGDGPAATDGLAGRVESDVDLGGSVGLPGPVDRVVDLAGALVVPGFVDAHVHVTDAGLALTGLDLSGTASLGECLAAIAAFGDRHPDGVLWGHGWDETRWPENRPPTRSEIDALAGGRRVYLSRIDVHSALVSTALVDGVPEVAAQEGFHAERPVTRDAHYLLRGTARAMLTDAQRDAAQRAFLAEAAAHGIVEVHECAGSDPVSRADLAALLALSDSAVRVRGYLAAAVTDPDEALALIEQTGAAGLAGDLSVDGAIGSRTASLSAPYADAPATRGVRYLSQRQITDHLVACTRAGVQAGFHAIGDDAVAAVARGLREAASALGPDGAAMLASCRHRIEHAEMPTAADIETFAATGVVASMQPLFDGLWGGGDGMYVRRLGARRAAPMNPFAAMAAAGVRLAFGSDAPVTAASPWAQIRAAVHHRTPGSRIPVADALAAHTAGGRFAGGSAHPLAGVIAVGAPADLAVFAVEAWDDGAPENAPLPDLTPGGQLPRCLATIVDGRVIFGGDCEARFR